LSMRFVRRRGGRGLGLRALVGQVFEGAEGAALRHFKTLCENLVGGELVSKPDVVSCVKETEAVGSLDDYVDAFHGFVSEWKTALRKPVEIVLENRLLGGWSETSSITYDPEDDEYSIYAKLYSECGVEPRDVEQVKSETISMEERMPFPLDVAVKAEGDVDQNPATDEFVGVGEAWASMPRSKVRSAYAAPELREVARKVVDMASRIAEEAQEKLIVPAESEWW